MADAAIRETTQSDDDFRGNFHVYVPYRAGLPRLKPYLRELWRRREFLNEMAKANIRGGQLDTWFGRLWNILNPLLLGAVYFLLVNILKGGGTKPGYFAYLLAGLFLFSTLTASMMTGVTSVVSAGKMVTNTAFPRAMLPLAAVKTAFRRLWPTLLVLAVICGISGIRPSWALLSLIPLMVLFIFFCAGIAMLLAAVQVYFRDTRSFLPYLARLWLYASPVLWMVDQVPAPLKAIELFNPMFAIVGSWSQAIIYGEWPSAIGWGVASAWAVVMFLLGGYVFLSRERDFAVRI